MDLESGGIAVSLGLLTLVLAALSARGFLRFVRDNNRHQVMWAVGLALGTVATSLELIAYVGYVDLLLLQTYVFCSAAIVGVLSLGGVRAFHHRVATRAYVAYIGATLATVAAFSFTADLPASMVSGGVISGNPPLLLLVLSSLVTVPATAVLLWACVRSLRKNFRWKGLLMISGACVLGAGGAFYIASFPVVLYYAEFVGIVLLFFGLVDFSRWSLSSPTAAPKVREGSA
jgi:hypothetical protein